jgi:hypothetical protein
MSQSLPMHAKATPAPLVVVACITPASLLDDRPSLSPLALPTLAHRCARAVQCLWSRLASQLTLRTPSARTA